MVRFMAAQFSTRYEKTEVSDSSVAWISKSRIPCCCAAIGTRR